MDRDKEQGVVNKVIVNIPYLEIINKMLEVQLERELTVPKRSAPLMDPFMFDF